MMRKLIFLEIEFRNQILLFSALKHESTQQCREFIQRHALATRTTGGKPKIILVCVITFDRVLCEETRELFSVEDFIRRKHEIYDSLPGVDATLNGDSCQLGGDTLFFGALPADKGFSTE
jgi:hypothetical protein